MTKYFVPPKIEEIEEYCLHINSKIDPQTFIEYYSMVGWTVGRNKKMKDWKAAVRLWTRKKNTESPKKNFVNKESWFEFD